MKLKHYKYYKYSIPIIFFVCLAAYKMYQEFKLRRMKDQLQSQHVDFDVSMKKDARQQALTHEFSSSTYAMFKNLYEKNNFSQVQPQQEIKIPKIIHQIWLGSPFPYEYKKYQESWRKHHPDWEYKLWTDAEVSNLTLTNQDLYDASLNYGEKSDILRYELLYRYGGLYVDVDFECLQPLDLLHHCYDFYIGIQPLDTGYSQLGIGLIGSVPGHYVLKQCINNIRNNDTMQIISRTGPVHCTKVFYHCAGMNGAKDVALPASYFYPCDYAQKGLPPSEWQQPESFAVHHWAASWTKPEGFVRKRKS
jgi:mannosyltransferase OCH1-like enzyme